MTRQLPRIVLALVLAVAGCVAPGSQPPSPTDGNGIEPELSPGQLQALTFDPSYDGGLKQISLAATSGSGELQTPVPFYDSDKSETVREYHVVAEEISLQIVPVGPPTKLLVFRDDNFNGKGQPGPATFPGPTILAAEGDTVKVYLRNNLPNRGPEFPRETNMHFHGMIIEPEQDGAPMNLVQNGATHLYQWQAEIGFPMTGWYHAHPHGVTHIEVGNGMLGNIIVLARAGLTKPHPDEFPAGEQVTKPDPVPAEFGDTTIDFTDLRLDENNQLGPDTEFDRINGREGNVLLVNHQIFPTLTLAPGEVRRVRMLDSSAARFYNLHIRSDAPNQPTVQMIQIGTDGGLFLLPEPRDPLLISNAERVEVLLKAPDTPGDHVLESLPFDRGQGLRERNPLPLMKIHVEGARKVQPPIPGTFRFVPNLFKLFGAQATPRNQRIALTSASNGRNHFTIEGKIFDDTRIDNIATFGNPEIWSIDNKNGNWAHPMHLHNIQYQVIDIDGKPEPPNNPKWKDTVNVPRSARARFIERFNDRKGMFFFHCHILQHEDDGLMTTVFIEDNAPPFQAGELPGGLGRPPLNMKLWCGPSALKGLREVGPVGPAPMLPPLP